MAIKKYDIHNPTPGPRVIYDAKHVSVTILPGQTQPGVELEDVVADEHKKRKGDLQLSAASGRTKAFIKDVPPNPNANEDGADGEGDDHENDDDNGGESDDDLSEAKKTANALIDEADETEFNEWKGKVKDALGENWPGGKPRKKDLLKLLKKVK